MTGLVRGSEPIEQAVGFKPALSSDRAGWRDLSLYLWRGEARECDFAPFGEALAIFHTGGARDVRIRVGSRWIDERSTPGLVTIVPPATPITWDIRGEVHSASVHLAPERFERLADDTAGGRPLERLRFGFARRDPLVAASIASLADELERPKERGSLYADTLADGLALHLVRNYAEPGPALAATAGLSSRALRLARERIEASVEAGISLDELAAEVGLSRSHFARGFRRSTGLSPHRYLTRQRIARARDLLRSTDEPLVEIALRCGFASQAHFNHSFRRATGVTPLAFRRGG
jgi:AraC family transcriptional regulator